MKKHTLLLALGAAIPLTMIVFWMLLDNGCTLAGARSPAETVNQCYTRWIGALSGWIGAVGAILAASWAVAETRSQTKQQTRQYTIANLEAQLLENEGLFVAFDGIKHSFEQAIDHISDVENADLENVLQEHNVTKKYLLSTLIPAMAEYERHLPLSWGANASNARVFFTQYAEITYSDPIALKKSATDCNALCKPFVAAYETQIEHLREVIEEKKVIRNKLGSEYLSVLNDD